METPSAQVCRLTVKFDLKNITTQVLHTGEEKVPNVLSQVATPRQASFIERAPNRWRVSMVRLCWWLSLLAGGWCHAQTPSGAVTLSYLEGQVPVAPDAVTTLGTDLFGDKVNLFNGSLTFEQTDTHLPGNSALPVALVRSYLPGRSDGIRGQFGDWDLEAPRMGGVFSLSRGWTVGSNASVARCSTFSLPPIVSSPAAGEGIVAAINFTANDYHQGVHISVAGMGRQEVLVRSPGFASGPTDGASYSLVTREQWQISCLPSIQNGAGEGFLAVSPQGLRYRFDWMSSRLHTELTKDTAVISRREIFLHATQVTDRFGNWVRYTYDASNPTLLTQIRASDGRVINIANENGVASSVNDGTRTLTYRYALGRLSSIELPDTSKWTFALGGLTATDMSDMGQGATCENPGTGPSDDLIGSMTHPSGATGLFKMNFAYHGRTYVDKVCRRAPFWPNAPVGAIYPKLVISQTLMEKTITGPGLPTLMWTYRHGGPQGWNPCTGCGDRKSVLVTEPGGKYKAYEFGVRWRVNEGQLLRVFEGSTGNGWQRITDTRYRTAQGQAYPEQWGYSLLRNSDLLSTLARPLDQRVVTQQGATFTWQVDPSAVGFDAFARPLKVSQFSSLNPSSVRTEATEYYDNLPLWAMGQRKRVVELATNREVERHTFYEASALKSASYSFGRLVNTFAYRPDGTLETLYDAANRPIAFQNFMRGKPQRAVFADGSIASRIVNNLGNVVSNTNEVGTTTTYTFDAMGRVASINYPLDPSFYAPTFQSFSQSPSEAFGLAAGHWRQTVQTGDGYRHRYFDALWRLRLEHSYDAWNFGATQRSVETRYGVDGNKSFESYPSQALNTINQGIAGKLTVYDSLDRVILQRADSELGPLDTRTEYLDGFQRRVTNPRGFATTYSFQAFDTPSEDVIAGIGMADGSWLTIARDVFSKPLSISRGGTYAGAAQQVTRSYVYDVFQRLCKTIEPETGATLQTYDLAGNLAWRASGLNLPDVGNCEYSSAPASRSVSFFYDARDRLLTTSYGDGSPGINRTYTADGLLNTIVSGGSSWGYSYNNRRLLTAEALLATPFSSAALSVGYVYDTYGNARYLVYPDGTTIDYGNNALGQPTQLGSYATGVAYHPNGMVSDYRLSDGRVHSTTLNVRGLPSQRQDTSMIWDVYTYDANGNVTGISDWRWGDGYRTMGYDALDRLTTAYGLWGNGSFSYDALDNLRSSVVGARGLTHQYADGSNRLTGLVGSQNIGFGYDANGNITQRGTQGFVFDIGNRIQQATGKASYSYDGHGRRYWVQNWDGSWKLQFYSQSGKLLLSWSSSQGQTKHLYLGDKLLAEINSTSGVSYLHTDELGSPVAKSRTYGGLIYRTRYEPYGATAAGTNPVGIGFTGHVNDGETGLVYMQQRYYDPIAGRFLSVDPVTTDAKTGDFFGRYHYANNNPYKFKDPDGRAADLALDLVFIAADLVVIGKNGLNLSNGVSLAGNLVGAAVPFATGLGKLASTAVTAGKVADTTSATRSGALASAKEANGIPRSAQPDAVIKPGTPAGNAAGLDSRNVRQYEYTNSKGEKISIREDKATSSEKGSQPHHFNAGPSGEKFKQHHFVGEKQK